MTLQRTCTRIATIGLLAFTLAGCATHHDRKTNNTLIGAGLGAATGAVFSGGDPLYTIGGAAAGGVLGNVLTQDRDRDYRSSHKHKRKHQRSNNRHDRRYR